MVKQIPNYLIKIEQTALKLPALLTCAILQQDLVMFNRVGAKYGIY